MRRTAKKPINLSESTHDRLKAYADRHGTVLDGIIRQFLDEKVGKA